MDEPRTIDRTNPLDRLEGRDGCRRNLDLERAVDPGPIEDTPSESPQGVLERDGVLLEALAQHGDGVSSRKTGRSWRARSQRHDDIDCADVGLVGCRHGPPQWVVTCSLRRPVSLALPTRRSDGRPLTASTERSPGRGARASGPTVVALDDTCLGDDLGAFDDALRAAAVPGVVVLVDEADQLTATGEGRARCDDGFEPGRTGRRLAREGIGDIDGPDANGSPCEARVSGSR